MLSNNSQLLLSDIYSEIRVDVNRRVKQAFYNDIIRQQQEAMRQDALREIEEGVKSVLKKRAQNGERTDIDFTYNFRKRMKALTMKPAPGYDFTQEGLAAVPDKLKSIYVPEGDYILYADTIGGCPFLLTDRRLYINDVMVYINGLQQVVCYNRFVGDKVPVGMCLVELYSTEGSKYTTFTGGDTIRALSRSVSAALLPYQDPSYNPIESYDNDVIICLNCHNRGVFAKGFKYYCPTCGKIAYGSAASCNVTEEKQARSDMDALCEKNLSFCENMKDYFADEECWFKWGREFEQENPVEDKSQTIAENATQNVKIDQDSIMFCPNCGGRIAKNSKFCSFCGFKIEPICPNCGKILKPGVKFCNYCGTKIQAG